MTQVNDQIWLSIGIHLKIIQTENNILINVATLAKSLK